MPDIFTLRICSVLASIAFAGVFAVLWHGRRAEPWLLYWGSSSALYAAMLITLEAVASPTPILAGILFAGLGATNLLMLAGVRTLDGQRPCAPWMLALVVAEGVTAAVFGSEASSGARVANAISLVVSISCFGLPLARSRADDGTRTARRVAGFAMLGYVPGFAISAWCELHLGSAHNWIALIPMLSDQLLLGVLNLSLLAIPGQQSAQALRHAAFRDPLTGAWNRAGLDQQRATLAVPGNAAILVDVDHFKQINDRHGHATGDAVLVALARALERCAASRAGQLVRLGGDEFLLVVPAATLTDARDAAEAVRAEVSLGAPGLPPWSVSIGIAAVLPNDKGLDHTIARADQLLYRAKDKGRDRIAA